MSDAVTNPMPDLYRRLRAVGLTRPFVRKTVLPDWWDDEVAANPAGYAEGLTLLSRHLGLDLATLRDPSRPVAFRDFGVCKYKKSKDATEDDLALARAMATRAAQLACVAATETPVPPPPSAAQIRREILGRGEPWVDLDNLADYCWSLGIPVIHLSSFPKKRPDGLSAQFEGRPVIVLCRNAKSPAWMLFILAHELGHIALGHIEGDGVLLDESMDDNVQDQEETAANEFAIELLTGDSHCRFGIGGRWPAARQLAETSLEIGRQRRIDPGHVILNHAKSIGGGFWAVANAALALIESKKNALKIVRGKMGEHLDWPSLPEDSSEFLMRVSLAEPSSDLPVG